MSKETNKIEGNTFKINLSAELTKSTQHGAGKSGSIVLGSKGVVVAKLNQKYLIKFDNGYMLLSDKYFKVVDNNNTVEIVAILGKANKSMNETFDLNGELIRENKLISDEQKQSIKEFVKKTAKK